MTSNNRRFVLKARPNDLPAPEHFAIESQPIPTPGVNEVLIRVKLVALSPWQGQRLKDFRNYTRPFEIGELIDCDVLGEVVAGESGDLRPGDRVTGRLGWQEYALATAQDLQTVSDEFDETLWLTALSSPGLTAYCALDMFAQPMPGQTMVVTSAAGSVGSYAVQLGKLAGMRVIGLTGSTSKRAVIVDQLGADEAIDFSQPDFQDALASACADGVHLVFDTVGGPVADAVFDNLAKYARVIVVGRTASNNSDRPDLDYVNMRQLWAREASIQCFSRYSWPREWAKARDGMINLCRAGHIKAVDQVIDGFDNTPAALRDMLSGKFTGKVMVRYA